MPSCLAAPLYVLAHKAVAAADHKKALLRMTQHLMKLQCYKVRIILVTLMKIGSLLECVHASLQ